MSLHRFFLAEPFVPKHGVPAIVPLASGDLHHARDVLRILPDEEIEAVTPDGSILLLRLDEYGPDEMWASVLSVTLPADEPKIVLAQGIAKGDKMDAIVRQAVEVGASRIVPVTFERTIVKLRPEKYLDKANRWTRIAQSAAKQAHRTLVPAVTPPVAPSLLAEELSDCGRVVVFWEEEGTRSVADALEDASPSEGVAVVVGPEGGLAPHEVEALVARGAVTASLGPTILRTETAAVVALALVADALRCRA